MRSSAGVITSLGLVLLLIALLVVPAAPVLAATPTLDVTVYCDDNDNTGFNWTTSSSNPTPDGGTADGAVHVTATIEHPLDTTPVEVTLADGEYNDGNGYTFGGSYEVLDNNPVPQQNTALIQVTVVVDGFNDGTGQGSTIVSSAVYIHRCKDGTTTTNPATTTLPMSVSATVTAACVLDGEDATYPITVTVSGDEGATGVVTINGVDTPYTIDDTLSVEVSQNGMAGDNTVMVADDNFGDILDEVIALTDCSTTTTTDPDDTTTTSDPDDTTTTSDPDDTTTTTDPDDTTTTTDPDDTTTTTEPDDTTTTTEPDDTTTTTGGDGTTTTTGGDGTTTTTGGDGTTTTTGDGSGQTTSTTDSSSNDGTTPVSVLPTVIEQTELPQTGIDNGPLAMIGATMLIGGAALLVAARRREALDV